jgi:hypothetical protein
MNRNIQLIIVCEDILHEVFTRAFLYKRGVKRVLFDRPPKGRGDAKQLACEKFYAQLKAIRKFGGNRGLIFMIDADNLSVAGRLDWIRNAGKAFGIDPPGEGEAVFVVVPKWEVGYWLAYMRGEGVDEVPEKKNYGKYAGCESKIYPLVERLADMCEQQELPDAPPSLIEACKVYEKFAQWKKTT